MDFFEELRQRQTQLQEQLKAAPLVDVVGIVAPPGAGASHSKGDELWLFTMSFAAWRIGAGELRDTTLTIRKPTPHHLIGDLRDRVAADSIIRIRARVAIDNIFGAPQALLEEIVGIDDDAELQQRLIELQKPLTHQDDRFGVLTYDRALQWYTGHTQWLDEFVRLSLSAEDAPQLNQALHHAHALWNDASTWNERLHALTSEAMLPLKNEVWRDDDEEELDAESFDARLTLKEISVSPDGHLLFWFDDDDMFGGHSIQVAANIDGTFETADLAG